MHESIATMNAAWNILASQIASASRSAGERRRACRYVVKNPESHLGWWSGETFTSFPCRLLDLSTEGGRVEAAGRPAPPVDQAIWLRPAGMTDDEWIEGTVVAAKRSLFGGLRVRVRFKTPLGYETFNQFVYGRDHILETPDRDAPEHERDHLWR